MITNDLSFVLNVLLKLCYVETNKSKFTFTEIAMSCGEFMGGCHPVLADFQVLCHKRLISSERAGVDMTQLPSASSFVLLSLFKASFPLFSRPIQPHRQCRSFLFSLSLCYTYIIIIHKKAYHTFLS